MCRNTLDCRATTSQSECKAADGHSPRGLKEADLPNCRVGTGPRTSIVAIYFLASTVYLRKQN